MEIKYFGIKSLEFEGKCKTQRVRAKKKCEQYFRFAFYALRFPFCPLPFVFCFFLGISSISAQQLPKKQKTLAALRLSNDYFMHKWTDVGKPIFAITTSKPKGNTWPSNIWTRAIYYEGLMGLYKIDRQKRYYDYAVAWGEAHKWGLRNFSGGMNKGNRNADDQCCGQTYLDLYLLDKKPERIKDIKTCIDSMLVDPQDGIKNQRTGDLADSDQKPETLNQKSKSDDWWWVDALQMAMPVFARLGVINNDNRYYEKMYEMYSVTQNKFGNNGLFNPEAGLWWRDKSFVPPFKTPSGKNCYWSRGNGWVLAAMVRTLDILPENAPHREEYLTMYLTLCKALLPLQRADGFWNPSLVDSTDFGGKELTGTSLFVYGMSWGINKGILDKKTYFPIVSKAWAALLKDCVHTDGKLGYVQSTGKEPKEGQPLSFDKMPDFEDFGLGCFLLAGSEVYKIK